MAVVLPKLIIIVCAIFSTAAFAANDLSYLNLPLGFQIEVWAEVPDARSMVLSKDKTTLYVGSRGSRVYAVTLSKSDFSAQNLTVYAKNLKVPNGIAIGPDGFLYVAEQHRIIRIIDNGKIEVVVGRGLLPDNRHHGWRYVAFGPDGYLYVAVGAPCNICEVRGVEGTILRFDPQSFKPEIYAKGVRNSVGFTWHPQTGKMVFTDNGGDNLGDLIPPDELNIVQVPGQHYGYPYEYETGKAYPQFTDYKSSEALIPPALKFEAHAAALGVDFHSGNGFPKGFKNMALVAQHGSWNRTDPIGYRIMQVTFDENGMPLSKKPFIGGWLRPDGEVRGRPVDLEELPDGSLLISDDYGDVIYRVWYNR
jgi:glucose/arabinose dehydrogenase